MRKVCQELFLRGWEEEGKPEEQKDPYNYFDPLTMKRATAHQNEALRVAAYKGNVDLVKHALEGNHLHHDIHHGTVHGVGAGPWANHGDIYYNRNYHDPFTTQYTALHVHSARDLFQKMLYSSVIYFIFLYNLY